MRAQAPPHSRRSGPASSAVGPLNPPPCLGGESRCERPAQVHIHPERVRSDLRPPCGDTGHAPSVRCSGVQGIRSGVLFRVVTSSGAAPQVPLRAAERDVLSGLLRKRGVWGGGAGSDAYMSEASRGGWASGAGPAPVTPLLPPASWGRPARTTGCRPDPYGTRTPAPRPPPRPGNAGPSGKAPGTGAQTTGPRATGPTAAARRTVNRRAGQWPGRRRAAAHGWRSG